MPLERPIVVTGTPRSGKSLVAAILAASGEFARVSEPLSIWDLGFATSPDDCRSADDATDQVSRDIRRACERAAQSRGDGRYLDDLAYHALRIPFLFAVLDDVRVIHVVRDARDAIPEMLYGWTYRDTVGRAVKRRLSGLQLRTLPRLAYRFAKNYVTVRAKGGRATWGPRVPGLSEFRELHSMAEVAAYQWLNMVRICRDDLTQMPDDRWLTIKHEELLTDPSTTGTRIGRFARCAEPEKVGDIARERVDPNHRFEKKVFPDSERWRAIGVMVNPLRGEMGYDAQLDSR